VRAKLDKANLEILFRFAIEEILRRQQRSDIDPLTRHQILKMLAPDYDQLVKRIIDYKKELMKPAKSEPKMEAEGEYAEFEELANYFMQLDQRSTKKSEAEEEKKEEDAS